MKKIATIFLILIYTGSALGIAVDCHYCNGHLMGVTIANFGVHGGCKCNPSGMPDGCCKDNMLYMKGGEHKSPAISSSALIGGTAINIFPTHSALLLNKAFFLTLTSPANPAGQKLAQPVFLLNRVLRI